MNQETDPQAAGIEQAFRSVLRAQQLARSKKGLKEAMDLLKESMSSLPDAEFRQIIASEDIQQLLGRVTDSQEMKPGDPVLDERGREMYRVPFNLQWLETNMETVEWTVPPEPFGRPAWNSVSWNGVQCPVRLITGDLVRTAVCFRDLVLASYRETLAALNGQERVLQAAGAASGTSVERGAGWYKQTDQDLIATGQWVNR